MNLSPRFEHALHYAVLIHAGQLRKGTEIPYLSHLLGVASIALEYGANDVQRPMLVALGSRPQAVKS